MATTALDALLQEAGLDESALPAIKQIVDAHNDEDLVSRLETLRSLAFTEYLQWATAGRRFGTISELDTARVLALFLRVRRSPLTVEALVEDLAIPQGRATSMVGRIKYGEGRALTALAFGAAAEEVERRLNEAPEVANRKSITVARDVVDRINEVAFAIMSAPVTEHAKGGKYESPEQPTAIPSGRYGATVTTSTQTWSYIVAELQARGGS